MKTTLSFTASALLISAGRSSKCSGHQAFQEEAYCAAYINKIEGKIHVIMISNTNK